MKKHIIETDDIWRLYRREWVIVNTVTMHANDAKTVFDTAKQWCDTHLEGRVKDNDIQCEINTDTGSLFWVHIKVFKDNLKGEFKYQSAAEVHASAQGYDEYTIVPRNSKADHDLRSYGVKKL